MFILYYLCLFGTIHVYLLLSMFILYYLCLFVTIHVYFILSMFNLYYPYLFCTIYVYLVLSMFICYYPCLFCTIHVYFVLSIFISTSVNNQNIPIFALNLISCFPPSTATTPMQYSPQYRQFTGNSL